MRPIHGGRTETATRLTTPTGDVMLSAVSAIVWHRRDLSGLKRCEENRKVARIGGQGGAQSAAKEKKRKWLLYNEIETIRGVAQSG